MNIFVKFKAYLRFKEAMRQADEKLVKTGQRHYVLYGKFCDLVVTDRVNFRRLRMKHYITNRRAKMADVAEECLYHTPYASGNGAMDAEKLVRRWEEYYIWYEVERAHRAIHKKEQRRKRRELRKKRRLERKEAAKNGNK